MKRPGILQFLAVVLPLFALGCGHQPQMRQLRREFASQVLRDDDRRSRDTERRLVEMSATDHGASAEETFELRAELAMTYAWAGQMDRALAMESEDLKHLGELYGPESLRTLPARFALAWTMVAGRRWADAGQEADRIAELCRHGDPAEDHRARCRLELDDLYAAAGDPHKANAAFLLAQQDTVPPEDPPSAMAALTLIGRRYAEMGFLGEARRHFRRCVDIGRSVYPLPAPLRRAWSDASGDVQLDVIDSAHAFDSQAPRCIDDLIALECEAGDPDEASALSAWRDDLWTRGPEIDDVLEQRVRRGAVAWQDDALTAADLDTLGWYRFGKGRPGEALQAWTEASRHLDRLRAPSGRHRDGAAAWRHADVLLGMAGALESTAAPADAEEAYGRAFAIADSELHPRHAWRLAALAGIASMQERQDRMREAEETWQRYTVLVGEVRPDEHVDRARGLEGLARARERQGEKARALVLRRQAARIRVAHARHLHTASDLPLPPALRCPPSPATSGPTENRPPSP